MTAILNAQQQIDILASSYIGSVNRLLRCVAYWLIAMLLLQANTYAIHNPFYLALGIGALGLTSESARMGQIGIGILLLMALLPSNLAANLINQG